MNLPPLDVLTHYAALSTPDTELPPDVYLLHDRWTLTIFDKFPKAKYHFLVLPRVPFPPADNQDDDVDDDSNELDRGTAVSSRALTSLQSLLTTTTPAEALNILRRLEQASLEAVEMVKDEMMKTEGFEWGVEVGFHAVPSMK
ncbi:hypothetical protein QFC22_000045 [Naganishia vaughanmartiniae]|uniref:Uncharacterized protein n=1 Tax=Naganishia vaughanmartiniae TaxID=1424756 RepID=A0ACC2XM93_9TREE|nr:hypothetical protein QFC22_000045 [Naganishia vaughanmartiniae]